MASPSCPSYISNLQNIRDSARETLAFIKQHYPHIQKQNTPRSAPPLPALRLPFPDELTDILKSTTVAQDTRCLLSERLYDWHHSIQELQTKKFEQACHDLTWLSPDRLPYAVENLRLTYEKLYMNQIVPRVRSDLLSMKVRFSQNGNAHSSCTKTPFNTTFIPFLEGFFSSNPYPNAQEREYLARKSKMTTRQIEVWFQNHRRRAKQDGRPILRKCFRSLSTQAISSNEDECYSSTDESSCEKPETVSLILNGVDSPHNFRPQHAFPTTYPPFGLPDPFPRDNGIFKFPPLVWGRKPATVAASHQLVDVDELCQLFASKLNLREGLHGRKPRRSPSHDHVWFASTTTIVPRAPHSALVRPTPLHQLPTPTCHVNLPGPILSPVLFGSTSRPGRPKKSRNIQGRWPSQLTAVDTAVYHMSTSRSTTPYSPPHCSRSSSSSSISSAAPKTPPMSPYVEHQFHELDFQSLDQVFDVPNQWEKNFFIPASLGVVV